MAIVTATVTVTEGVTVAVPVTVTVTVGVTAAVKIAFDSLVPFDPQFQAMCTSPHFAKFEAVRS